MSTEQRIRKAWLAWVLELKYSESTTEKIIANAVAERPPIRLALRMAFEAGYRAKRKDNDSAPL